MPSVKTTTIAASGLNCRVRNENGCDPAAKPPEPNTRNSHFVLKDLKGESVGDFKHAKGVQKTVVLYRVPHERLDILVHLGSAPCGAST